LSVRASAWKILLQPVSSRPLPARPPISACRRVMMMPMSVVLPRDGIAAGDRYPGSLVAYRTISLPLGPGAAASIVRLTFPAFGAHSTRIGIGPPGQTADASVVRRRLIAGSPYERTYALAQRLSRGTTNPETVIERVYAYL